MINRKLILATAIFVCSSMANAAEHTVKMLTSGANGQMMVMEPAFIKIAKGDTVKFVPSDATHNAQSYSVPAGAASFMTPMGQTASVTFSQDGVYLYKCIPHLPLGMVGVIQVGKAVNLAQAKQDSVKLKALMALNKERLDKIMAQIK
ncbi:MAG: pseudoazurin [Psychrobium sp.]|nr:pseudoazurin [Psychrobium sp.]